MKSTEEKIVPKKEAHLIFKTNNTETMSQTSIQERDPPQESMTESDILERFYRNSRPRFIN
jgi:hypothetical protein